MEDLIRLRDLVEDDSYMASMDNVEGLSFFIDKTKLDQNLLCRLMNDVAKSGDIQLIKILISLGPKVEMLMPVFITALEKENNFPIIRKILDSGFDPNDIIDSHITSVVVRQSAECLDYVLSLGARYKVNYNAKFVLLKTMNEPNPSPEKLEVLLKHGFIKYFDKELIRDSRITNFKIRELLGEYGGPLLWAKIFIRRLIS